VPGHRNIGILHHPLESKAPLLLSRYPIEYQGFACMGRIAVTTTKSPASRSWSGGFMPDKMDGSGKSATSTMSPVTSKPASRGRIKTSHSEVLYSYQVS
jgi:hypothetical protein